MKLMSVATPVPLQLPPCALLINGQWRQSSSSFDVINPANGQVLAQVASASLDDAAEALAGATSAFAHWRRSTATERAQLLQRWQQLMLQQRERLAQLLCAEQGKPLAEARAEIDYAASYLNWFAGEALRLEGDWQHPSVAGRQLLNIPEPVGVVLALTPWNFPAAMVTRKLGAALAAGCTVLLKPAESTPLTALALAELAIEAGIAPGVLQVLPCATPDPLAAFLLASPQVAKVSFTGSTAVGRLLMQQSAATLKRLSLELGGNAPVLVFADADLDAAVAGIMAAKFRNAGQTCICINRVLADAQVAPALEQRLAAAVMALQVGAGQSEIVQIGPLISAKAVQKVQQLVDDAIQQGARVAGQQTLPAVLQPEHAGGCFYPPTLLADVTMQMAICQQEIFGPVLTLQTFTDEAQALQLANQTDGGLAAYLFGGDEKRNYRLARQLTAGMVGINTTVISDARIPFGGVGSAGFGREGSKYGVADYLQLKHLCWELAD
ncbi:MAG: NAD-dependent succinate-semialdehyde dehydrogenase [Rheinheimera sp.]|nr:NAD-dependent succinate-semialdehyde dehydrogenase [Rheinheimera sp.]